MNSPGFVRCVCPVCQTEFVVDPSELPRDFPHDSAGRLMYPCADRHPMVELWQAWRNWYGVGDAQDIDYGPPRSSPGYSEASGIWD